MRHSILAIELCLRLDPGSRAREELKDLVLSHPAASTPGLKWKMLGRAAQILLANLDLFEKGCWDFFDDDGRALSDYEMWSKGMITEEGARREPSGEPGREPRFMTFTIALLMVQGTPAEREVARLCEVPERDLWKRATFERILRGLPRVNFASVKSDVLYLIPGDDRWGLTAADLEHTKFEYLREIG
jgi:hypothetical protein